MVSSPIIIESVPLRHFTKSAENEEIQFSFGGKNVSYLAIIHICYRPGIIKRFLPVLLCKTPARNPKFSKKSKQLLIF